MHGLCWDSLLRHVEGYGDVRLSDVADVEVIDNSADSYTRLNGEKASILKIYKNATSSAGEVSDNCLTAFKELEKQYDGLHMVVLSNQGNYITIVIQSILTSMVVGAALAIIVLAIFLKDIKPTLVVGISIPLSVLFAVVLMYFTGLDRQGRKGYFRSGLDAMYSNDSETGIKALSSATFLSRL